MEKDLQSLKTMAIISLAISGLAFMQSAGICTLFGTAGQTSKGNGLGG